MEVAGRNSRAKGEAGMFHVFMNEILKCHAWQLSPMPAYMSTFMTKGDLDLLYFSTSYKGFVPTGLSL